jgi:cytochrome c
MRHVRLFLSPLMNGQAFFIGLLLATGSLASGLSHAQMELAKDKHCLSCHAIDKKVVGPSYLDVAAKYSKDALAKDRLAQKIMKGGSGVWGVIPMPANPQVNPQEAQALAAWVLQLKAP